MKGIVNVSLLRRRGLAIDLVRTIIPYRNNSELIRIVEAPQQNIEEDMLNIST